MACLHLDGHTPAPEDPAMHGYQVRGHIFEDYVEKQLLDLFDLRSRLEINREEAILWDHGVMHADFYIPNEKLIIEHKSRTSLEALDSDWMQLAGQIHYHPEATRGELWITHPVTLEQRRLPFELLPHWKARVVAVSQMIAQRKAKGLPGRICSHPGEARQHFCRFSNPCFDDWQPPPALTLDEERTQLAQALYAVEAKLPYAKGEATALETLRETLRDQLAPFLENGADYRVDVPGGQIRVRRTVSAEGTNYDMKAALAAGAVSEQQLAPFAKARKGAVRWTVDASGDPARPANDDLDF